MMSFTQSLISFSFFFLLCLFTENYAMLVSTQLQAFVEINTLLRTVMCSEMYKSIKCMYCMYCMYYVYQIILKQRCFFNNSIMKSYQFKDNNFRWSFPLLSRRYSKQLINKYITYKWNWHKRTTNNSSFVMLWLRPV